jgi:anaerobic magnesium-protoporphyrin IX monomethyl ester cyclase
MPDVLLTHSYHLPSDRKQFKKMQVYPPLGTLYAAAAVLQAGFSVAVFDSTFAEPLAGFNRALRGHRPKIVVIYEDDFNFVTKMCLTHMRELALRLSQLAHNAGAVVIAHGSDATDHAEEYLGHGVDYILNGEAESTLADLCDALLAAHDIEGIPGLVCRPSYGQLPRKAVASARNPDWVRLPMPDRALIDMEPYRRAWQTAHGYFSTSLVSSRGCPYRCNWCAKPISGNKFHLRAPEAVAEEMRILKSIHGAEHLWFGDDVFALNTHWVEQFAREVELRDCAVPFKIQSRADLMSPRTVFALQRAGCTEVWMGVESGSQKVLDSMDKGLRLPDVRLARERLSAVGIRACYFLQFGYPGEGWPEIMETVELVRSTRPSDIGVSLSYPLPGTRFHSQVHTQLGSKRNWTDSDDLCAIFIAAYSDAFYCTLRDALHAEVNSWITPAGSRERATASSLWRQVVELEAVSRNEHAFRLAPSPDNSQLTVIPLHQLIAATTGA